MLAGAVGEGGRGRGAVILHELNHVGGDGQGPTPLKKMKL